MDELASIVKKFRVLIPDLTKDEASYILYSVLCLKEKDFTIVRNLRFSRSIKGIGLNNQDCVNYVRNAVFNYYPNRVQDLGFTSVDEFRVYIDNYLKLNSSRFSLLDKARFMEVCPLESANLFRIFISEIKNEYKNLTDFNYLELITIKSSLIAIRMIYKRIFTW